MKTIRRFSNVAQAGFARCVLQAAGIPAVLADEHAYTLGPQYAPWGIRLQVPEPDIERAARVLDQQEGFSPLPDDFVPPPEPSELTEAPSRPGVSLGGAFLRGGFLALGIFGLSAAVTLAFGGRAYANPGGIVLLFGLGGCIGMIVRAIHNKGRRADCPTDRGT